MKKLLSIIVFALLFSLVLESTDISSAQYQARPDFCWSGTGGISRLDPSANELAGKTSVKVIIDPKGLANGTRYGVGIDASGFQWNTAFPNDPANEARFFTKQNDNPITITIEGQRALENDDILEVYVFETSDNYSCKKTFAISGGEDTPDPGPGGSNRCTLQISQTPSVIFVQPGTDLIYPKKEVYLKITGPAADDTIRKGVRILDTSLNRHFDSCIPLNDLLKGVTVKNGFGTWYEGNRYEAYVTESCGFFNEPQGAPECRDVFIIGDKNEKILKEGDACNPEDNRCDAIAPFCVKTAYDSNKGVCSVAEKPVKPCKDGICKTALGNFRYSPAGFAKSMLTLLLSLSGGILLVFTIINGYKLMISQGDPEKIKEAREGITGAIAGLLLIIFSIAILQLITVDILGLPGFSR